MMTYPEFMHLPLHKIEVKYVIPMFHIMGHGDDCQMRYSLHYLENMARTDGENIERGWVAFNPTVMQVQEMGSRTCQDVLNFHLGSFNWQRTVSLGMHRVVQYGCCSEMLFVVGTVLLKKLVEVQKERAKRTKAHDKFSVGYDTEMMRSIKEAIKKWNNDPVNNPDPYSTTSKGEQRTVGDRKSLMNTIEPDNAATGVKENTTAASEMVEELWKR